MGVNKVVYGTNVIVDISDSTVAPEDLMNGETAYDAKGDKITGTFTLEEELTEQGSLITQIMTALNGKAAGGGTSETWTFTMEDGSTVEKDVVVA